MKKLVVFVIIIYFVSILSPGCSYHSEVWSKMDQADSLMWSRPDSSMALLREIDTLNLNGKEEKARYALLMSMALDKNYIDTTNFSVLQPAIDYYLKKGTPDDRLRTYYYQAQIYSNMGELDSAMVSLLNGGDVESITDSLMYAHLLVSKGLLYYHQYKTKEFVNCNIAAANIYDKYDVQDFELKSYCRALNGATVLNNKILADSLKEICMLMIEQYPEFESIVHSSVLLYILKFGDEREFYNQINLLTNSHNSEEVNIILAQGLSKFGNNEAALNILENMSNGYKDKYSLKYHLVYSELLEKSADYKAALVSYHNFVEALETYYYSMISRDLLFAEKKHELEVANLIAEKAKQKHVFIFSLSALTMVIFLLFIYYHYSLAKANSLRKQAEVDRLEAEQKSLQKGNESLELKNRAAELELKQKELEMENLRLEISQAEEEQARLKQLLEEKENQNPEVSRIIKERLSFLNGLIAKDITNNKDYADSYQEWIEHIRTNQKEFMKSTRLILSVSHPEFIDYLEEKNLTDDEINYVCLYAIGLRGKEIGEYIKLRRHYVISSAIRKKLGLDEHGRNLGPYIRELMENR